jgi:hypothetical protein
MTKCRWAFSTQQALISPPVKAKEQHDTTELTTNKTKTKTPENTPKIK